MEEKKLRFSTKSFMFSRSLAILQSSYKCYSYKHRYSDVPIYLLYACPLMFYDRGGSLFFWL